MHLLAGGGATPVTDTSTGQLLALKSSNRKEKTSYQTITRTPLVLKQRRHLEERETECGLRAARRSHGKHTSTGAGEAAALTRCPRGCLCLGRLGGNRDLNSLFPNIYTIKEND